MGNSGQVSEMNGRSNNYIEEVLKGNDIKRNLLICEE
jgi:hypothetical protein